MKKIILIIFCVFISAVLSQADVQEFKWGGSGFDMSSRFWARSNRRDADLFEILVDSKQTFRNTAKIIIRTEDHDEISSLQCYKAYRHPEAPYACTFKMNDFLKLNGTGHIKVFNQTNQLLLEDEVKLDELKSFIRELKSISQINQK